MAASHLFGQTSRPTRRRHPVATQAIHIARPRPTHSFRTAISTQGPKPEMRIAYGKNPKRYARIEKEDGDSLQSLMCGIPPLEFDQILTRPLRPDRRPEAQVGTLAKAVSTPELRMEEMGTVDDCTGRS